MWKNGNKTLIKRRSFRELHTPTATYQYKIGREYTTIYIGAKRLNVSNMELCGYTCRWSWEKDNNKRGVRITPQTVLDWINKNAFTILHRG
jgi:hypothetical protein